MTTAVRRRAAAWALALVAGIVAVVLVVVLAAHSGSSSDAAHPAPIDPGLATRLAESTPPSPSSSAAPTTPSPSGTRPAPSRSVSPSARPTVAGTPTGGGGDGGPLSVSIPAAGVDAPVVPIGVDDSGSVEIPADVRTVGWYRYSPRPRSSAGSTVLVGHVDSAEQGEGAFFDLHELRTGTTVTLRLPHGASARYRVVSKQQFSKGRVPLAALFSLIGAPRLTLITCGGSFDETIRSYRDNIVVTAVPA